MLHFQTGKGRILTLRLRQSIGCLMHSKLLDRCVKMRSGDLHAHPVKLRQVVFKRKQYRQDPVFDLC